MADTSIRNEFIDGIQEIFTTLFNEGVTDGIEFYPLSDKTTQNVYNESKFKVYRQPITLVAQAWVNPKQGEQYVEKMDEHAQFVVPLKSLQENEIDLSIEGLQDLRNGMVKFHDRIYHVDNVTPRDYVEDVFLLYLFDCVEEPYVKELTLEESDKPEEQEVSGG